MTKVPAAPAIDDEVAAFYAYLKARLGEPRDLSLREASQLYREYLADREEAHQVIAGGLYISTSEAARAAGVSIQTIRNWVRAGIVPDVRVANRKGDLRIPADFMEQMDYGVKGNPDYADPQAFVRHIRDEHEKQSEADYFALLDTEAAGE